MTTTPPGASLLLGTFAGEHYVPLHNLVVRGKTAIHTKYVGIWGYITSHRAGWKLTQARIAKDLNVGTDFVSSALKNIEKAGCLIREQPRRADGTLGEWVWFVTDVPLVLQQMGITDPDTIDAAVREDYANSLRPVDNSTSSESFPSAAPEPGNPVPGVTSENTPPESPAEPGFPSAAPEPGYPDPVEPAPANPAPKKNKGEKTIGREDHPEPFGDVQKVPDLPKTYRETAGHSAYGETKQGDLVRNQRPAGARTNVGPAAMQAVTDNPSISEWELAEVVRLDCPELTRQQALFRASLFLSDRTARSA